jgi:Na+-translocating ferredoxin:NAD+ oxidoreductase subunit B
MSEEIYEQLREFLDRQPAGFPKTPTGVEIKILKKMFTPEQAALALKLSSRPETAGEIAERTGLDKAELAVKLEKMATEGLIFRVREGEKTLYQAFQFLVGLYEFQLGRLDREFCELFEEYMPYVGLSIASYTSQMRIVPVASSLENEASRVAPYNRVRELVEKEDLISIAQCICKKEQGIMGHPCSKPQEVCMMFGNFARFFIDNHNARQISREEALKVMDLAEENGLVLTPTNTQKLEALCCCCSCCCPNLKNIKMLPNPGELVTAHYRSLIDGDLCTGCGECIEICPMEAIRDENGISKLTEKRCIGCGLCVNRCPVGAISMVEREEKTVAPLPTMGDVLAKIAEERGLG